MLITSILYLLLSSAVTSRRDMPIYNNRNLMIILLNCFIIALLSLTTEVDKGLTLYGSLYNITTIGNIFHIFIFLVSFSIISLTSFYPRKIWYKKYIFYFSELFTIKPKHNFDVKLLNKESEQFKIIEYPLILLFIITGAILLISSSDIISVFLSIELQSYGLYLLSTLYRNSELSTSAGLTYFLLGSLSSCFILLGTALLYVNSGTTNLECLYIISNISDISNNIENSYWYNSNYINYSLLIMSCGFLFKISAAPFHFWSPDVYDALPTIVTTFVAIIAKISILVFLFEIVNYTIALNYNFNWTIVFLISSLLSLIIGTVLGLNQHRIKRLFAYSTISHLGFILLTLSINSVEAIQAFIFYLIQYTISNLNLFIILISIGYTLHTYVNIKNSDINKNLLDKNNSPIQLINQLKGYFFINPIIAISFTITIYSLVGIPPLIGFFGKQMVLSAALDYNYVFIVFIAILTSVISAVYYLNLVRQIFFEQPDYKLSKQHTTLPLEKKITIFKYSNITISSCLSLNISIITLIILLFIVNPGEILRIANLLAVITFNP